MNKRVIQQLSLAAVMAAAAVLGGCAAMTVQDRDVGLRKAGVFETVRPAPFGFDKPAATIAPLPGSGMPPMISHTVDEHLPLTVRANDCLDCHDKPQNIGKPVAAGKARPAPASHYQAAVPGPAARTLDGRYYVCTGCHAPQADVAPLVRNASM